MKLNIVNISESSGISKKTQKPFMIRNLTFLSEFENVNSETFQRSGIGLTVVELPISDRFYPELERRLQQEFKDKPLIMELETSVNSRGTIITGFSQQIDSLKK